MLLQAGLLSLALLLASRLIGLLRESAQAAAFGTTGLGDLAVLMLSLPDWVAGVLASGALAYVLVPAWAGQPRAAVKASQHRLARILVGLGGALTLCACGALALAPSTVLGALAPGVSPAALGPAVAGLAWSAAAVPLALLAALWGTRLQHEGDALGLYGANLVVNLGLVLAIAVAGWTLGGSADALERAVLALGVGLMAAMASRLLWQAWRMARAPDPGASPGLQGPDPAAYRGGSSPVRPAAAPAVWTWALLSAGLPLALPFAARSLASGQGEGALAAFNYGWKLVELPLMLAIQLVATLAFPRVATAVAEGLDRPGARAPLQAAFGLAFVLACAAAAGLLVGAPALAQVLFGWGRMSPDGLAQVAAWGQIGAWGLLPQAVLAVGLTVLAAQGRLRAAALGYAAALAALLGAAPFMPPAGGAWMALLNALYTAVACGVLVALGPVVRALLPWRAMGAASLVLLAVAAVRWHLVPPSKGPAALALVLGAAAFAAAAVLAAAWWAGGSWRQTLRR